MNSLKTVPCLACNLIFKVQSFFSIFYLEVFLLASCSCECNQALQSCKLFQYKHLFLLILKCFFFSIFQCASPCWGATFPALARSLFCAPVSLLDSRLLSVSKWKRMFITWLVSQHNSSYVQVCWHQIGSLESLLCSAFTFLHFRYICSGGFMCPLQSASNFIAADVTLFKERKKRYNNFFLCNLADNSCFL